MDKIKNLYKLIKHNTILSYNEAVDALIKYSEICELENEVASLSNWAVARALDSTLKEITCMGTKPNMETQKAYLELAIKDLISGMDAAEMLWKYDRILYKMKYPRPRGNCGYRDDMLIIDEFREIDVSDVINNLKT